MSAGMIVAERARELLGVPYRPQGRSRRDGLDCVGLVAVALALDADSLPRSYSRHGSSPVQLEKALRAAGLVAASGASPEPGDVLVFRTGPAQLHLGVFTREAFVHADAGLRRTVERPLPAPWPIAGLWRPATTGETQWRP